MKNTELTPLEIMEFEDIDYMPIGGATRNTHTYILESAADSTNLYKCLKANIICSRRIYEKDNNLYDDWDIDLFRDIVSKNYYLILFDLNFRWKISILECFSYDGTSDEQLLSSLISQLHHLTLTIQPILLVLSADDFYNSIHATNFKPDLKDISKIIIRIKSIIPKSKQLGLIALDILRDMYVRKVGIFSFVHNHKIKNKREYINYLVYSSEFDSKKLYGMAAKKYYK